MQVRHTKHSQYFEELGKGIRKHIIPYLSNHIEISKSTRVLEIGCGKGGNLLPFLELGCNVTGIDISPHIINVATELFENVANRKNLTLIASDIYDIDPNSLAGFDIIIMRDVIEHIHDQEKFMSFVKKFLSEEGVFFLAFPPWHMPFGGHQQTCESKFLSICLYTHLLPTFMYRGLLRLFKEDKIKIEHLIEIKETGISIERFERCAKSGEFNIEHRQLFLVNPAYEFKFGLKPRKQSRFFGAIPFFRNFYTSCAYYILKK